MFHSGGNSNSDVNYDQLVGLVGSLKLENSTLKKKLQTNSTQIMRLENEAENLKQMVLKLVSSLPRVEKADTNMHLNGLDLSGLALQNNFPESAYSGINSLNSDVNSAAERMHRDILKLTLKRYEILDALKSEEIKKECYLKQLSKLQCILDPPSDEFAKHDEKTRSVIEAEILKIQNRMAEYFGPQEGMNLRVQSWLNDIQNIEKEILTLKQDLALLESTKTSPVINSFQYDENFVQQSREVCTQTMNCVFHSNYTNCCDDIAVNKNGFVTRSNQTSVTSILKYKQLQHSIDHPKVNFDSQNNSTMIIDKMFQGVSLESISSSPTDIDDTASMHSFTTSLPQNYSDLLCPKVDVLYSLLPMLGANESETCRNISSLTIDETCKMRQAGCIPVLVQFMHDNALLKPAHVTIGEKTYKDIKECLDRRKRASLMLHNIVQLNPDAEIRNKEMSILMHFEKIRLYCEKIHELWVNGRMINLKSTMSGQENKIKTAFPTEAKESWNENYDFTSGLIIFYQAPVENVRYIAKSAQKPDMHSVINELGGLFCHAELLVLHYRCSVLVNVLQKHALCDLNKLPENLPDHKEVLHSIGCTLIGLSYKNPANKASLIKMPGLLETIAVYLERECEEIQQIMTNCVRNLSWQAGEQCREVLLKSGITPVLMKCALKARKEETKKNFVYALWNLSGHCPQNREDICAVEGALAFLVSTLTYRSPSKSSAIIEGGGGILRNVSSVVATNEQYRQILRDNNCLHILLTQLTSPSITIVNNACGTLWNLSARNVKDQRKLRELGAEKLLRNLVNSKHAVISQGSRAALRNLQADKKTSATTSHGNTDKKDILEARKKKNITMQQNSASAVTDENFSPRHHAWINAGIPNSSGNKFPQRHSLQETSAENMLDTQKSFKASTLHYSGSVGSIPSNHEDAVYKNHTISGGNVKIQPYTQQRSSYPSNFKKFVSPKSMFNHSYNNDQNHASFRNIIEASGGHMSQSLRSSYQPQYNNNNNAFQNVVFSPSILRAQGNEFLENETTSFMQRPSSSSVDNTRSAMSPQSQWYADQNTPRPSACFGTNSIPGKLTPSKSTNLTAMFKNKSPEEALRNLQNDEENYVSDDGPVDYSKQFCDETQKDEDDSNMSTHEVQAYARKQSMVLHGVGAQAHSEAGFSSLSSCVGSNLSGNSAPTRRDITQNENTNQSKPLNPYLASIKNKNSQSSPIAPGMMDAIDAMANVDDEKPKNYGEIFAEKMTSYVGTNDSMKSAEISNETVEKGISKFSVEDASVTSQKHDVVSSNGYKYHDDKFESKTGTITPGTHYKVGRKSGTMTPKTPNYAVTPLVYSRNSSMESLESFDAVAESINSCVTSAPGSRMMSGMVTPELPDSPSQSMPISPGHSPRSMSKNDLTQIDESNHSTFTHSATEIRNENNKIQKEFEIVLTENQITAMERIDHNIRNPSELPSFLQADEMRSFNYEGSISGATTFSALTIDTDIQLMRGDSNFSDSMHNGEAPDHSSTNPTNSKDELSSSGLRSMTGAGYLTSLPTNDEIKSFVHEGTFSPMVALSEISVLNKDNDGFEAATTKSSRSSATGASIPVPAPVKVLKISEDQTNSSVVVQTDPVTEEAQDESFDDSCTDEEGLLSECIESAIPKKTSSKRSSKSSSSSSRSKDKSSTKESKLKSKKEEPEKEKLAPKAERKINIKQKIANAENRLKGISIAEYMDNLMKNADETPNESTAKSKQVIDTAEKLEPSYSVMKHKRENEKQKSIFDKPQSYDTPETNKKFQVPKTTGLLPFEPLEENHRSSTKVHAFLQNRPMTYVVEGTPVEMSRCTSLSNLTVESGPHEKEFDALRSKLKPSRSTSDMEAYCDMNGEKNFALENKANQNSSFDSLQIKYEKETQENVDSRQILEDLGKQIDSISISTSVATGNTKFPGYVQSLPQSDEIIKYSAEGSLSGGTIFSSLTIDSDTKIAPCVPDENHNIDVQKMPMINENVVTDNYEYTFHPRDPVITYTYDNETKDGTYFFHKVEDTPVCFSRNSSLSSLDFDSEEDNDLLSACISSAIPPEKQQNYPVPQQLVSNVQQENHNSPCCVSGPFTNGGSNMPRVKRDQTFIHSPTMSPTSEEWSILRNEANAVSANLIGSQNGSSSNTYNDALSAPTDNYYRLSKQQSAMESDLSIGSSVFSEKDNVEENQRRRPKINPEKPQNRPKAVKGGKKVYKANGTGKIREPNNSKNRRTSNDRMKDNISSSSSSYKKRTKHHSYRSGNNITSDENNLQNTGGSSCGINQHPSHFYHTCHDSHENMTSPKQFRKKSVNSSCSKQSGACDANQLNHYHTHQRQRTRHANKNIYHPSVVQMYPPIKDLQQVVLNGVANQAARGETVVAVGTVPKQRNSTSNDARSDKTSQGSRSQLMRQNTYIKDDPSPELFQSLTSEESRSMVRSSRSVQSLSPANSKMSVQTTGDVAASPKGSMMSVRSQPANMSSQIKRPTKPTKKSAPAEPHPSKHKGKGMWKGLKKLLSPSDEPKTIDAGSKVRLPKKTKASKKTVPPSTSNMSLKSVSKSKFNEARVSNKEDVVTTHQFQNSDSLSLSSSSASNNSFEGERNIHNGTVMMVTDSTLPYGHIPTNIKTGDSAAVGSKTKPLHSVWRRTPPMIESISGGNEEKQRHYSSQLNTRTTSQMSIASKHSTISTKSDVWVHKDAQKVTTTSATLNKKPISFSRSKSDAHVQKSKEKSPAHEALSESSNLMPSNEVNTRFSPNRTQSPRIVQVAPFNYRPSKAEKRVESPDEKSASDASCQPDPNDTKQTVV